MTTPTHTLYNALINKLTFCNIRANVLWNIMLEITSKNTEERRDITYFVQLNFTTTLLFPFILVMVRTTI